MSPVIIAVIGVFSTLLTYYFTKSKEIEAEQRKLKLKYYENFIKALSDVAIDNHDDDAQRRLSEGFNSLIVIASPKVVQRLMEFHDFIRPSNTELPRESKEWLYKHDEFLRILVKEIRKDIYGIENGVEKALIHLHLIGQNPKSK